MHNLWRVLAIFCLLVVGIQGHAQTWPAKPIQIIVPFAAGGGTDILARLVAPGLGAALGQQVVVVNKPGASGIIGTELVAKASPDGHTVLLVDTSIMVNPSLKKKLPYDTLKDLQPVLHAAYAPVLLVTHPSVAAHSVRDLVLLARGQPRKLSYASGGNGSSTHLAGELFKMSADVDIVHIPYKGVGAAFADVVGGQVSMFFAAIATAGQFVADGKLRALALTGSKRHSAIPNVPTFGEAGFPSVDVRSDWGFLVPAGTPRPIVDRLNLEIAKTLSSAEVKKRLVEMGYDLGSGSPEAYGELLRQDIAKWKQVIERAGIQTE